VFADVDDGLYVITGALGIVAFGLGFKARGVAELASAWSKRGDELGLGIGIATGYATIGRIATITPTGRKARARRTSRSIGKASGSSDGRWTCEEVSDQLD
jgi:hypothetical protein